MSSENFNTLRALLDSPERWSTILTLSRSPPSVEQLALVDPASRSHIKHVSIDFSSSASEIKDALAKADVKADYVFFYAYLQPKSESHGGMGVSLAKALYETNVPLFGNFVTALELAEIKPRRILLQTVGKNYGIHIGRVRTPLVESDPQPRHLQTNFYYAQEDRLFEFCKKHPETKWNVIRPARIIGSAPRARMNTFYSFAIYAAIQARKGEPLKFNGDFDSCKFEPSHSSAILTGDLSEWVVLGDKCVNQAFNAQDCGNHSWDRFFEEVARWFGVEKGVVGPEEGKDKFTVKEFAGGKDAPLGYGPPTKLSTIFTLQEWFEDPTNKAEWKKIMAESAGRVTYDVSEGDASIAMMGDFAYLTFGTLSMNKARKHGWTGHVDFLESIFEMYQEMAFFGMLPSMEVTEPRPLV
ncbi:hypothetical protein QQZ08_009058 [Neonectria magnoliae]|uniref:PRISE-like Rossmann-fold domain-containing protein n=1 Tax=Neonectria magnoliae TaxID=2732573 RepID=A0ABR1HQV1_9HYPO